MNPRLALVWSMLLVAMVVAYWPAMHGTPVWDDAAHLTRPALRSWQGLAAIWTEPRSTQQYYPLTHSAFWVMHRLWGDSTFGYHAVNVTLHGLNATLVLVLLRLLRIRGSVFAAGLFLLHPVQVESVAWMTELKNTLSGFFALSASIVYWRARRRALRTHEVDAMATNSSRAAISLVGLVLAFVLFLLGLLSKTAIVTWPAAMLVLIWWRDGRVSLKRDALPLMPFFVAAIIMGALTAHWEINVWGAQGQRFDLSPAERLIVAGRASWFYLGSLIWPVNHMFFYPRWIIDQMNPLQYAWPAAVIIAIALAWLLARQGHRHVLATLLLYGGMLVPCLGFINLYWHVYTFVCDHMQYVPCISVFALLAAGVCRVGQRIDRRGLLLVALKCAILATLAVLTFRRSGVFVDSETLWKDTIARNGTCWMACNNLGIEYQNARRYDEAVAMLRRAVEIKPDHASAWTNLGMTLLNMGQADQAMIAFDQSLAIDSGIAETHFHVGRVWASRGRHAKAIVSLKTALAKKPDFPDALTLMGVSMAVTGQESEAITAYRSALAISPNHVDALNNLAWLLATTSDESLQDGPGAVACSLRALAVANEPVPELLGTLAASYARSGYFEKAAEAAQQAAHVATTQNRPEFARLMVERKALFESRKPYTEGPPSFIEN